MSEKNYLNASNEAGREFLLGPIQGEVTMLNLLKFRSTADYSNLDHLAPAAPISGEEAYNLYLENTLPFLKEAGSEVLFVGKCSPFLIGPAAENWDFMLLVKHSSKERFIAFAANTDYLKITGHRSAAITDSRLLPIEEINL
jgi:uncharacterized protein (DUF1330 family)